MTEQEGRPASARWTDFLGWDEAGRPDEEDPAEVYHEASKNLPSVRPVASPVAAALDTDPQAQATIGRAVKRHPILPTVALPDPRYPATALERAIRERRSRRIFGPEPVALQDLSTLLHASYGVSREFGGGPRQARTVPSGGALYPLEVYPAVRNVAGLAPGLYHYDPSRHLLEVLRREDTGERLGEIMIPLPGVPDVAQTCAVVLFVVGVFWRTRFKYGLRGYRWVLIEAGHLAQNGLLAAEALEVGAVPYGGLWDRRVDDYLGIDGVNESVVYSLVAGSPADDEEGGASSFS